MPTRNRRPLWVFATAVVLALVGVSTHFVVGQTSRTRDPRQTAGGGRVADLKDILNSGLRARRPVEFEFIDRVVRLVETEKLPLKMVMETFQYARRKRPYPFQYFQRALVPRAARIGVVLTPV